MHYMGIRGIEGYYRPDFKGYNKTIPNADMKKEAVGRHKSLPLEWYHLPLSCLVLVGGQDVHDVGEAIADLRE